ncbi:MAG: imidazole glycerol phosphate synthase subunit HisH [Parcubacteria group bacterium]|nr:imidazole glycerol phosphate synthase subunit HisH [Parcubacteria group bacterium]|tara:strand:- start:17559 stop:18245 length:687 start_codon:yes stop_codon:yes gene_type:complete
MAYSRRQKIAIVDYGMGNLFSVKLACERVGLEAFIVNKGSDFLKASALILPGVGAFGEAMDTLNKLNLIEPIRNFIDSGKPFLGICLGMQLLMSESEEFGLHKGLDIIKGRVIRFPLQDFEGGSKVPQVGWNKIFKPDYKPKDEWENSLLKGIKEREDYIYFVHSFYTIPASKEIILSLTSYAGVNYCSSLQIRNIFACQFHPERSGPTGLQIYENLAILLKTHQRVE